MPNKGNWMKNSFILKKLIEQIHENPTQISAKIDESSIILVGHSFGGSAVSIAAGAGAPVKGLVLLDPAVVHEKVKHYLKQVAVPIILLGADRKVFRARKRSQFYNHPKSEVLEVSISGATHDDAQNPSMFSQYAFGLDPYTSNRRQEIFVQAITTAVFSLSTLGNTVFAWHAFKEPNKSGIVKNVRRSKKKQRLTSRH